MVDNITLPVVIPDRLLISPGIWNENEYSAKEIGEAFARTSWEDKEKISLWLNHDDTNTSAFVGYVKNPKLASEGRVFGDLELWDEKTATILTQAMAKFGVSAKIKGEEDKTGKMHNFSFENFSVVTVPACSDAYINLAKKETKTISKYLISNKDIDEMLGSDEEEKKELARGEGKGVGGEIQGDGGTDYCYCPKCKYKMKHKKGTPCSDTKCPKCGVPMTGKEMADNQIKVSDDKSLSNTTERRLENMVEEEKKEEEVVEEVKEEVKEEPKEEVEAELSEKDMLKSLCSKFDKLVALLSKKLEEEKPEEKEEESSEEKPEEVEKENKELSIVKKELAEIKEKLNAPKSKTIRNLSSNTVGDAKYDINEFSNLLGAVDKPMKFI